MKRIILLFIITSSLVLAQESNSPDDSKGFHKHDGFYLSLNGGLAFGTITLNAKNGNYNKMEVSGAGYQYELKIGSVISEEANLILSLDIIENIIPSPIVTFDGVSPSSGTMLYAGDAILGLGITKYFMPANIFIIVIVGEGMFSENISNKIYNSQKGFGYQLKCGKEWWVLDYWGFGVAAGVGYLSANGNADATNPSYSSKYSTTTFFVVFNSTFN